MDCQVLSFAGRVLPLCGDFRIIENMKYQAYLSLDPHIRFGRPCIVGTRIAVYDVLGWLAQGMSILAILEEFPELEEVHIRACLAYAADRERRVRIAS